MARISASDATPTIRPLQYRDLDELRQWQVDDLTAGDPTATQHIVDQLEHLSRWYGPMKVLSLFPNPLQPSHSLFVAKQKGQLVGLIQVAPINRGRSTWQVEQVVINRAVSVGDTSPSFMDVGSRLLRYCFETVWEARTWLSEVDVNNKSALALYRFNGFQPLAQVTYWSIPSEQLQRLTEREPDLPNLLPVSNADAQLLYQLETAAMPPLVRQVFDQQIRDFKTTMMGAMTSTMNRWMKQMETVSAYVFEHQRKAAIGYFKLSIARDGSQPHQVDLTVHPAYTWLYPELLAQLARILQPFGDQPLWVTSLDYQPEREEYLNQIQASPNAHALLMSRSVWHKVRETKPVSLEGLQLSDVLSGLQPAGKPVPGRMSWTSDPWGWQRPSLEGGTEEPTNGSKPLGRSTPSAFSDSPNAEGADLTTDGQDPMSQA